ncbi:MAG: phosphoglucosamine mutase [Chthoniobacterales bacterium]
MSIKRNLFGTDGVRGIANVEPVTVENALKLGRAAAHIFSTNQGHPQNRHRRKIVIGKDTRLSGYMLESAIMAGVTSMGVDVILIGPLPTPGVAYITRSLRADAGIVLTASHNSYEDNGIKFFRWDGFKLDDEVEARLEQLVFSGEIESIRPTAHKIGKAYRVDDALGRYVEFAKRSFPRGMTLESLKIAVDCANGAGYKSTPYILRELGAEVIVAHNEPSGTNINDRCGSTYPEEAQRLVRETGADIGITHDGDADRVLLIDEDAQIVDGDEIMTIAAIDFLKRGELIKNTLMATVMSNYGLEEALAPHGGKVIRASVGDRYVIEAMMRDGYNVGGEQSGHMIFTDYGTTGDGIVCALQVLRVMIETGKPLRELRKSLHKYPQVQRNLKVTDRPPIDSLTEVKSLLDAAEQELNGKGRVLLRYSGTEPKIRLLIEGRDEKMIKQQADKISGAIQKAIGA